MDTDQVKSGSQVEADGNENSSYFLPKPSDDTEAKRLDQQHSFWMISMDSALYISPLQNDPANVLDLATGTGIWATEFAQRHPKSDVLGVDLSVIKPEIDLPNCKFIAADITRSWENSLGPGSFDFIHSRTVITFMRDWKKYFERCYASLSPGGWLEVQEVLWPAKSDRQPPPELDESPHLKWSHALADGSAKLGIDSTIPRLFKVMMEDAGFVEISERWIQWPFGTWAQEKNLQKVGELIPPAMLKMIKPMSLRLLNETTGWTVGDVERLAEEVSMDMEKDLISKRYYIPVSIHCGRKPR